MTVEVLSMMAMPLTRIVAESSSTEALQYHHLCLSPLKHWLAWTKTRRQFFTVDLILIIGSPLLIYVKLEMAVIAFIASNPCVAGP